MAGLVGTVVPRVQLATLKAGKEHNALGSGHQYSKLRKITDEALEDHGAVASQSG